MFIFDVSDIGFLVLTVGLIILAIYVERRERK